MSQSDKEKFIHTFRDSLNSGLSAEDAVGNAMKAYQNEAGMNVMRLVDKHGNFIEKTPDEYPYTFDTHVVKRWGDNEEVNGTIYSDRAKNSYPEEFKKYFDGQWGWDQATQDQLKDFLNECFDYTVEKVILLMKGSNSSSGFPFWVVQYKYKD